MVWQVFKDEDRKLFEILGQTHDDSVMTIRTAEMTEYDIYAQCSTTPAEASREHVQGTFVAYGYKYQEGLFRELCVELERRKAKGIKKDVLSRSKK